MATTSVSTTTNVQRDGRARRIWEEYRGTGDRQHRDRLIAMYTPLVRSIAYDKAREVPLHLDADDLVSAGIVGLIEAVERWDPDKGVSLATFAWTRVHGSILDELRSQDWAPRRLRRRERDLMRARERVNARLSRAPTDEDLAEELGMTPRRVAETRRDVICADVESLNVPMRAAGASVDTSDLGEDRIESVPATGAADPAEAAAAHEMRMHLGQALASLPERDRQLAQLLYVDELSQRETAVRLGVTESRVSQMHSQMRNRLRLALGEHRDWFRASA